MEHSQSLTYDMPGTEANRRAGGPARWWWAVAAGIGLGLPFGWLLSYGAALLAFLGLFFFMLFGLLIGAVMFRIAQKARPIGRGKLWAGVALVAIWGWGVSVAVECYDFPSDVAEKTIAKLPVRPDGMTPAQIRAEAKAWLRDYLREAYPPGGSIGYLRWKTLDDRLVVRLGTEKPVILRFSDNGAPWMIRVSLSLLIYAFAIRAIVRPLTTVDAPRESDISTPADPSV